MNLLILSRAKFFLPELDHVDSEATLSSLAWSARSSLHIRKLEIPLSPRKTMALIFFHIFCLPLP